MSLVAESLRIELLEGSGGWMTNAAPDVRPQRLTRTSEKPQIPWREPRVALVLLRAEGRAEQSHVITEKLRLVEACGPKDHLLAVWMQLRHPVVLWVDDLEAPRAELSKR
jgi:hypothetical protein